MPNIRNVLRGFDFATVQPLSGRWSDVRSGPWLSAVSPVAIIQRPSSFVTSLLQC